MIFANTKIDDGKWEERLRVGDFGRDGSYAEGGMDHFVIAKESVVAPL